jgi:hypothetical protein
LLATTDYRVLATAKTDAPGMYAFKVPDVGSMSLLWATRPMSPVLPVWISGNRFMHA